MNLCPWRATMVLMAALALLPAAQAQQLGPRIGYVYPAGGQQGATFQVVLGGQRMEGVTNVVVSGGGVRAKVLEHTKPLSGKEKLELQDKLKELQEKRDMARTNKTVFAEADLQQLMEIKKKLAMFIPRNQLNPALVETITVELTIAPDAECGERNLRVGTPLGLSNPLVFCVGQLPEFSQLAAIIHREPKKAGKGPGAVAQEEPMTVTVPAVLNGQIMPGAVDRFRFTARKDQKLVIAAKARALIPYLADAVPGWFQATLALYDATGREVAYDDDFRFNPDPVLYYVIPADGEYKLEIKDSIYRGREDFVYRISISEDPFITGIFPLGGRAGADTTVELKGWNLSTNRLTLDNRDKASGFYPLAVRRDGRVSNTALFAVDTLPECFEKEPNSQHRTAQAVTLPVTVNGRIEQPGDRDYFKFDGQAGDQVVAEVQARRLNSPLDSLLKLTNEKGDPIAVNDDCEDKGSGLETHHADSYLRATLPAKGTYYLQIEDAQHKGGPEYAYRLRISAPRPDFALRVVPSSLNLRAGGTVPVTVYALRRDGFTNAIAITLKNAPQGFKLSGGSVPAGQDQVKLTMTAPIEHPEKFIHLDFEGMATINSQVVMRVAVPAEDLMQAFFYRHLVPAHDLSVNIGGRWKPKTVVTVVSPLPLKIPVGGAAAVKLSIPGYMLANNKIEFELSDAVEGVTIKGFTPSPTGAELVFAGDAAKSKVGQKGNLIVVAYGQRPAAAEKEKAKGKKQRFQLATLPAIPFEVIKP